MSWKGFAGGLGRTAVDVDARDLCGGGDEITGAEAHLVFVIIGKMEEFLEGEEESGLEGAEA